MTEWQFNKKNPFKESGLLKSTRNNWNVSGRVWFGE